MSYLILAILILNMCCVGLVEFPKMFVHLDDYDVTLNCTPIKYLIKDVCSVSVDVFVRYICVL